MKLEIIRIENRIVTCKIEEDGTLIDVGRRWFSEDVQEGDTIEFTYSKKEDN